VQCIDSEYLNQFSLNHRQLSEVRVLLLFQILFIRKHEHEHYGGDLIS